jgi:ABC-2 type transport system permease protein
VKGFNAFKAMTVANLKMTVRNRTALFWNLAFPLLFILLFGFLIGNDRFSFDIGVVGADTSEATLQIVEQLEASDAFSVKTGTQDAELEALRDGRRSVVIVFSEGDAGQVQAHIYWDQSDPQMGTIALNAVRQFLSEANASLAGAPPAIDVQVQAVESDELDYIDFLIPGILAMSLMNSGMIGFASAFVSYRERGILRRIKATPFPLSSFIGARITSQLVVSVIQTIILVGVGMLLFDLSVTGSLLSVFAMVILGSLAFQSLGFVISAFAKNQEAADSISNAVSFPMLFLSGVFFPVDSAPAWLQPIMKLMPLRYLVDGLRDLMVRGASLTDIWLEILVMLVTAVVGFVLALRFFRWDASGA